MLAEFDKFNFNGCHPIYYLVDQRYRVRGGGMASKKRRVEHQEI